MQISIFQKILRIHNYYTPLNDFWQLVGYIRGFLIVNECHVELTISYSHESNIQKVVKAIRVKYRNDSWFSRNCWRLFIDVVFLHLYNVFRIICLYVFLTIIPLQHAYSRINIIINDGKEDWIFTTGIALIEWITWTQCSGYGAYSPILGTCWSKLTHQVYVTTLTA